MEINESLVEYILSTYYDMSPILGSIRKLYGYTDKNYSFTESQSYERYVMKLVNPDESQPDLTKLIDETLNEVAKYIEDKARGSIIVVPKLVSTSAERPSGFVTIRVEQDCGEAKLIECNFKLWHYFDGLTVFDFLRQHKELGHRSRLYARLGRACNEAFGSLSGLCHIRGPLRDLRQKHSFAWDVMTCSSRLVKSAEEIYANGSQPDRRALVEQTLQKFNAIRNELESSAQFVLHGDLGSRNMLLSRSSLQDYLHGSVRVDDTRQDICLIDFQDIQVGPQVVDLSNTLLYLVLEQEVLPLEQALVRIPRWFLRGYQSTGLNQLDLRHLNYVPLLMRLRLCQSLINGLIASKLDSDNSDVMHTNQRGWKLLELMCNEHQFAREYLEPVSGRRFAAQLVWLWMASE